MPGALALVEGLLDAADEADVLIDDEAEGECVVGGLAGVEVVDAELEVGEGGERGGEGGGELDLGEGGERRAEVGGGGGEGAALADGEGEGGVQGFELVFEGVEVDAAVEEPLLSCEPGERGKGKGMSVHRRAR